MALAAEGVNLVITARGKEALRLAEEGQGSKVVACEGADIRTVEGYEDDAMMADLRAAFTAEHGLQCGFCTPGMVMSAKAFLDEHPKPAPAEVRAPGGRCLFRSRPLSIAR